MNFSDLVCRAKSGNGWFRSYVDRQTRVGSRRRFVFTLHITFTPVYHRYADSFATIEEEVYEPFPDLMTPDPLLDTRDVTDFPPSKDSRYHNRVIVRNHSSIFHEAMERNGFDFDAPNYAPATSDLNADELTEKESAGIPSTYNTNEMYNFTLLQRPVSRQTEKGKQNKVQIFKIMGDGNGLIGYGMASREDGGNAVIAATIRALKSLDYIDRFESRTIWTDMETKMGATRILLRPRPVGFGLRCGPVLHQVFKAAGIKDISAKVWGSRNPMMVMQAALRMLQGGHAPLGMGDGIGGKGRKAHRGSGLRSKNDVERERGRKLINLRK